VTVLPERDANGQFPSHSWPGAYPLVYLTREGNNLCAACASANDSPGDPTVSVDTHWEGSDLQCDECNEYIRSAYGTTV